MSMTARREDRERHLQQTGQMHATSYLLRRLHMLSLRYPAALTHAERGLLMATREGKGADTWWALRAEGKVR